MNSIPKSVFLLLLAAAMVSCDSKAEKQPRQAAGNLNVSGYEAKPQRFEYDLLTPAELLPDERVELMAPVSGQVLEIFFREGERVSKGEPIIRLDDRSWKAELIGVEAELETAEKDLERKRRLLDIEGSTQEEVDRGVSTVASLQSRKQQLEVRIDQANVTAPFSGRLGMRNFSRGAFLQAGAPITTLTSLDRIKVEFTVSQELVDGVRTGQSIRVLAGTDTLGAEIYAMNPYVDEQSRTVQVRALIRQAQGRNVTPGSFAEVLISTRVVEDALLVPTQAIVPEINDQTVFVYHSGKAERKLVELGGRTSDRVHVLSGISPGDTIITTGLLHVRSGMGVNLEEIHTN